MLKIGRNKLLKNNRQFFKLERTDDGTRLVATLVDDKGKVIMCQEYQVPIKREEWILLFDKIIKYDADLCTMCEIIQDNVSKR